MFKTNLDRLIVLLLYLIALFLMTLISVWHINQTETQLEKLVGTKATQVAEQLSAILSIPGWDLDETLARPVVFAALKSKDIYAVKISDLEGLLEGQRRNQNGELEPWDGEFLTKTIQAISPIWNDGKRIGTVEVYLSFAENSKSLTDAQHREILGNTFWFIFLNLCLLLYFWHKGDLKIALAYIKTYIQEKLTRKISYKNSKDQLASCIDQAQQQQIVDPEAARHYLTHNDAGLYASGQIFAQLFQNLPPIMTHFAAQKDFVPLAKLAHTLTLSAQTIGAHHLAQSSALLEEALKLNKDPEIAAANCIHDLRQVLNLLKNQAAHYYF